MTYMATLEELEARLAKLEGTVDRLDRVETIVDKGTPAGQYTVVVEQLMKDYGWTAEEAVTNFNNLLANVAAQEAQK
jgi:hypothetical protein